jgi:PAS domain S-box-containing protein
MRKTWGVDTLTLKRILFSWVLILCCQPAYADIFWFFREADGSTNWQYVANFVGNILIIALAILSIRLYFTRRQAHRYNNELEDIQSQLEQRVAERTQTLDKSNKLLKTEVSEHKKTSLQLQKSEAYINSILQSLPMILIGLNHKNEITQWNNRAEIISGVNFSEALGTNLWKTFPAITVTPDQVKQAQDDNKIITVKYSQRGQYQFDITIYPLQREHETGVVILLDDVTQRAKNENMLIQRDKMSAMGEMAAVMANDINKPLTAIIKDVKTVRQSVVDDSLDTEGLNELLEETIIRGQQASAVITNLLNFSASGGGEKSQSSIVDVVKNSLELANDVLSITDNLRFTDINVQTSFAEDLAEIPCYMTELKQALLSILRYSCYALDNIDELEHRPEINIDVSMAFGDLWLRIQHNGKGISLEEQKNLFEPFNHEDADKDGVDKAMHLSFCHFIICEQHQGQIAVTYNEDEGTIFHIQLPCK